MVQTQSQAWFDRLVSLLLGLCQTCFCGAVVVVIDMFNGIGRVLEVGPLEDDKGDVLTDVLVDLAVDFVLPLFVFVLTLVCTSQGV